MKKTIVRGLPESLAFRVREAIGITSTDATRAAALGHVLGWHLTVTGAFADRILRPTGKRKKRTKR